MYDRSYQMYLLNLSSLRLMKWKFNLVELSFEFVTLLGDELSSDESCFSKINLEDFFSWMLRTLSSEPSR